MDITKGSGYTYRTPFWKSTPTGGSVYGITNDGCSAPLVGDYPNWPSKTPNFRPACDAHDYGYGLIRNKTQPQSSSLPGLPRSKRPSVDAVFQTILKTRICAKLSGKRDPILGISPKEHCNRQADVFHTAVRAKGDGFL
ncbi:hypothetical protein ACOZ38_29290 [Sphaerisporangium viridialbum]|uniref:hypothetical protein n=1 Tax=Sphaerisporangium viridialbum TaxID=46189 RepID=UPI003C74D47C